MQEALRAALKAAAEVAAQCGGRVDWDRRPQASALPSVTLNLVASDVDQTMDGPEELVGWRVQVDCWGASRKDAKLLARAVKAALPSLTASPFQAALLLGESDDLTPGEAGLPDIYRTLLDVRVWAQDAA